MSIETEDAIVEAASIPADTGSDPAAPAPAPAPEPADVAQQVEDTARASFREGMSKVDEKTNPDALPPLPKEPADVLAAAAAKVEPVVDPATILDPAAKAAAEDAAEAAEMGLRTKKANDRFKEMKTEIRESAPYQAALKEAGIQDVAGLKATIESARRTEQWEEGIRQSTATPEQFGSAMNVIKMMNSNEPQTLKAVYDALGQQMDVIGEKIGITRGDDPLAKYPDLKTAVENMEITPQHAAEVARLRAAEVLRIENQQRQHQTQQQTTQQQNAAIEARNNAIRGIDEMSNTLAAQDPDFKAKLTMITPQIKEISEKFPPQEWVARIAQVYAVTRLPVQQPARVRPGHVPLRPSAPAAGMHAEATPANAFRMGVQTVQE